MMSTNVDIEFPDGRLFRIPCQVLAEKRADYYAVEVDGYAKGSEEYLAEVAFALLDTYEIKDYAQGNMNWEDLEPLGTWIEVERPKIGNRQLSEATWTFTE